MTPGTLPERLPAPGEIVHVRSRTWLVEEVVAPASAGTSALVKLACADDDAQGQTLDVFWDYEIDRRILQDEGWSDLAARGFDPPRRFAAFLHTLRWNCVTATDPNLFQAPFRAGIKIDAYGWTDVPTTCEFLLDYEVDDEDGDRKKPWRCRWPDAVRDDVLARLLELNAERAREEARAGAAAAKKPARGKPKNDTDTEDLFS